MSKEKEALRSELEVARSVLQSSGGSDGRKEKDWENGELGGGRVVVELRSCWLLVRLRFNGLQVLHVMFSLTCGLLLSDTCSPLTSEPHLCPQSSDHLEARDSQ